jgi:hypothetical protein
MLDRGRQPWQRVNFGFDDVSVPERRDELTAVDAPEKVTRRMGRRQRIVAHSHQQVRSAAIRL